VTYVQETHQWLPKGWVMEIRAGGEKMDKMYKVYICIAMDWFPVT
jgi:hypothetical protein